MTLIWKCRKVCIFGQQPFGSRYLRFFALNSGISLSAVPVLNSDHDLGDRHQQNTGHETIKANPNIVKAEQRIKKETGRKEGHSSLRISFYHLPLTKRFGVGRYACCLPAVKGFTYKGSGDTLICAENNESGTTVVLVLLFPVITNISTFRVKKSESLLVAYLVKLLISFEVPNL